ncbi:retinoblastoma-like protein 2 [Larimichthys crocea]|nr:retinoblastoma-like protein 2 [Larimichthys crocea]XP_019129837.1 retinoblastoma-like protein 2 [Larimichthys crocea]TMS13363.1 Chromodomain-helicase-DNA-binding protein 9 [Larimichthys crocea]
MATEPEGNLGKRRFGPSDRLKAMFRACSRDPTEAIEARLRSMLQTFLQHRRDNAANESNELAAKCCCEAGIWYYRILENHASEERNRLGISDISAILENDLFQRCLVACCLEMSISWNRLQCDFPSLLQIIKLAPYHFWKVIELELRADVGLPHAVVTHLAQVEDKVLESMAWTSDSPLWEEIRDNEGHLPTCQQVIPPTQLEDLTRTDLQADENLPEVSRSLGREQSGSTDRQRSPSAVNRPRRRNSLHIFARKVYRLMAMRLRELCSTLHISDELRSKIWTCFEYSLVNCTGLMIDRHLDQLVMCAIYIIAKITNVEIPFKHIMNCYKSRPLASKSVCKNVLISGRDTENSPTGNNSSNNGYHSDGILTPNTPSTHYPGPWQEERGNLIYFYNQVYTTKMEGFAKKFAPTPGGETPPSSPYPRQFRGSSRRRRLSSSHSIFISPYNTESTSRHTSGLCYYFNSSPPERLREINIMVKTGRSPIRRSLVSLDGDDEEENDGPSAKRLHLDDQSAWQRRLRNVENDRMTIRDRDQPSPVTKPNQY